MSKQSRGHHVPLLGAPGELPEPPLYLRLYQRIRDGVMSGSISPGTRLSSARTLAREEGISRNTVEAALSQLQAEGFLVRRVGSGTWVSDRIPQQLRRPMRLRGGRAHTGGAAAARPAPVPPGSRMSAWGRSVAQIADEGLTPPGMVFAPCVPGVDALPLDSWNRIAARLTRRASGSLLFAPPPAGVRELRDAVATYLSMSRGVGCTGDQVMIVNSTQQAIDLIARVILDPGDGVWMEDPGYPSARHAFAAAGAKLVPVPVDTEGVDVAAGSRLAPRARLAYVTPSHQYPLGVTLSLERRLALLNWAARSGGWIVEDDYDSELRYDGRPHASIRSIDTGEHVLYVGTFNKILFPTLRIAYLVLPQDLVEPFARARAIVDGFSPPLAQRVLAEFIRDGYFSIHLRKVRNLYQERRDRFLHHAAGTLPEEVSLGPAEAGIHLALHLPGGVDDAEVAARAHRLGLALPALSAYCMTAQCSGLLVHYANVPVDTMERGVHELGRLIRSDRGAFKQHHASARKGAGCATS